MKNNHIITDMEKLLLTPDQRRLSEALSTRKPLPTSDIEECQELDDELAADPLCDRPPRTAPRHKINRVLGILDQLDRENSNRRFNA